MIRELLKVVLAVFFVAGWVAAGVVYCKLGHVQADLVACEKLAAEHEAVSQTLLNNSRMLETKRMIGLKYFTDR